MEPHDTSDTPTPPLKRGRKSKAEKLAAKEFAPPITHVVNNWVEAENALLDILWRNPGLRLDHAVDRVLYPASWERKWVIGWLHDQRFNSARKIEVRPVGKYIHRLYAIPKKRSGWYLDGALLGVTELAATESATELKLSKQTIQWRLTRLEMPANQAVSTPKGK